MVDRTSVHVTIHFCPPHRVRPVLDVLDEYGLYADDDPMEGRSAVFVGRRYSAAEIDCGSSTLVRSDLIDRAPEVAFTVYEEPAYDGVGTVYSHVSGLGLFAALCGNSGEPMFSRDYMLELEGEPAEVRHHELGVPWTTAIGAMPDMVVVAPDRFDAWWNLSHGEVAVLGGTALGEDLILSANDVVEVDAALSKQGLRRFEDWTSDTDLRHVAVYRSTSD